MQDLSTALESRASAVPSASRTDPDHYPSASHREAAPLLPPPPPPPLAANAQSPWKTLTPPALRPAPRSISTSNPASITHASPIDHQTGHAISSSHANLQREASDSDNDANAEHAHVNEHTKRVEFHGKTSSMAVLGQLQDSRKDAAGQPYSPRDKTAGSLISNLHNSAFSPAAHSTLDRARPRDEPYYFRQAHIFIDGYFSNLHFIHPFLNHDEFVEQAEVLWFKKSEPVSLSFKALYYSVLSLGALTREWESPMIEGMGRFDFSRKLFNHAQDCLDELRFSTDLETVQCNFLMVWTIRLLLNPNADQNQAKICQNELSPHRQYMSCTRTVSC